MQTEHDYSVRYSENWSKTSAEVKRMQSPDGEHVRCACCGKLFDWQETETHHLFYISGTDGEPGKNLVAVCGSTSKPGTCHHLLHSKKYYVKDEQEPVFGNKNTDEVVAKLQSNWVALRQEITGFPSTYQQQVLNLEPGQVITTPQGQYSNTQLGDIAPGFENSARYKKELEMLALELAAKRLSAEKGRVRANKDSVQKAIKDLTIPVGILIVILLTILIAL